MSRRQRNSKSVSPSKKRRIIDVAEVQWFKITREDEAFKFLECHYGTEIKHRASTGNTFHAKLFKIDPTREETPIICKDLLHDGVTLAYKVEVVAKYLNLTPVQKEQFEMYKKKLWDLHCQSPKFQALEGRYGKTISIDGIKFTFNKIYPNREQFEISLIKNDDHSVASVSLAQISRILLKNLKKNNNHQTSLTIAKDQLYYLLGNYGTEALTYKDKIFILSALCDKEQKNLTPSILHLIHEFITQNRHLTICLNNNLPKITNCKQIKPSIEQKESAPFPVNSQSNKKNITTFKNLKTQQSIQICGRFYYKRTNGSSSPLITQDIKKFNCIIAHSNKQSEELNELDIDITLIFPDLPLPSSIAKFKMAREEGISNIFVIQPPYDSKALRFEFVNVINQDDYQLVQNINFPSDYDFACDICKGTGVWAHLSWISSSLEISNQSTPFEILSSSGMSKNKIEELNQYMQKKSDTMSKNTTIPCFVCNKDDSAELCSSIKNHDPHFWVNVDY